MGLVLKAVEWPARSKSRRPKRGMTNLGNRKSLHSTLAYEKRLA